jgi:hypothetical protein
MKRSKVIDLLIGLFIGLVLPWLSLWLYYTYNYSTIDFSLFLERLWISSLLASMLSIAALVNLLTFFIFIWRDKDTISRGILFATILYAFVVFGLRLFGS